MFAQAMFLASAYRIGEPPARRSIAHSVRSCDFVEDHIASFSQLRLLMVFNEGKWESLAIDVARYMRSQDVILTLSRLMRLRGQPACVRLDNDAQFNTNAVITWLRDANADRP